MSDPPARTLRDLLAHARQRHEVTSWAALEKIGRARGHKISHTTLSQLFKGTYSAARPDDVTLRAVAFLAGASLAEVYEAAGLGPVGIPFAQQLPNGVDALTPDHREVALTVIRALLKAQDALSRFQANGHRPYVESDSGRSVPYLTDSDLDPPDELPQRDQLP